MIAAHLMWTALNLHHAVLAIKSSTSGLKAKPQAAGSASDLSAEVSVIDTAAHSLYTGARQLVSDIAGMCWTDRRDPRDTGRQTGEVRARSRAYIQQLSELIQPASSLAQHLSGSASQSQAAGQGTETRQHNAQQLLSSVLADAGTVLQACQDMSDTALAWQCDEHDTMFSSTFNSNTRELDLLPILASLHPAIEYNDGLDWSVELSDYLAEQRLLDRDNPQVGASLAFPTPFSLLRTFPPAPADSAQWSASFFTNCCPVRPRLGVRQGLLKLCGYDRVRKNDRQKVIAPEPPAAGASAAEVAAYMCQAEVQLGPLLHAVAPVAAAITQRPWPWVGGGSQLVTPCAKA
jgi:hypothetical protein